MTTPPAVTGGNTQVVVIGGGGEGSPDDGGSHVSISKLLVKWWGLPYDACTWEFLDVHPELPSLLHRYQEWGKTSIEVGLYKLNSVGPIA
jgi:hypothetical protein